MRSEDLRRLTLSKALPLGSRTVPCQHRYREVSRL